MDIERLTRIEARNQLGLFTLALIIRAVCMGLADRSFGHLRAILAAL